MFGVMQAWQTLLSQQLVQGSHRHKKYINSFLAGPALLHFWPSR